ncbi:uncharacterized protein KZ484_024427 [Pholidichthys leucotaenia]
MVQLQLSSLDQLRSSGFGRPPPRHGLQLLFWFSNTCVSCHIIDSVVVMKLVSNCQPENGSYGFHLFGNMEELLPVLSRAKKRRTKVSYFGVGNLNRERHPDSVNLPAYVRENHGFGGDSNIDRIIIGYQLSTRLVEMVYITEHNGAFLGRFRPEGTYQISSELILALQDPGLDLTAFLTMMGYYGNMYSAPALQTTYGESRLLEYSPIRYEYSYNSYNSSPRYYSTAAYNNYEDWDGRWDIIYQDGTSFIRVLAEEEEEEEEEDSAS